VFRARWARLLLTTLALAAAVACLLGQVFSDAWPHTAAVLFPPVRTATPTATPVIPTPLPVIGNLAPPPTDCPASPPLDSITVQLAHFQGTVTMYGRSPVWMPDWYALQGTRQVSEYEPGTPTPYPALYVVWELGPTSYPTPYPTVTIRVRDLQTGELAWWSLTRLTPQVPILVFEPQGIHAPGPNTPIFDEEPVGLIVTRAGCYRLDVSWDGGAWSSIFAVGGRVQA
jgi:hypothetical protein